MLASAHGRPPSWVDSIQGAELWAMSMATSHAMPGARFVTDCQTVQTSWERGCPKFARFWCAIMADLDEVEGTKAITYGCLPTMLRVMQASKSAATVAC